MSMETFSFESLQDKLTLAAYSWPVPDANSVVLVSHGLGEHARRYHEFAQALNDAGISVYALDHRGHGASIKGQTPGCFDAPGWNGLVADLAQLAKIAIAQNPGLPITLFGHSMGSFAAQSYMLKHSDDISLLVLSGSAALEKLVEAQVAAMSIEASRFKLFNAAFAPSRTEFDWLSRDDAQVDKYIADPLCGFELDQDSTMSMLEAAAVLADQNNANSISNKVPVLLAAGSMDPVTGQLAFLEVLETRYKAAGFETVDKQYYEGARHEILNETNRTEVTEAIIAWIKKGLGSN